MIILVLILPLSFISLWIFLQTFFEGLNWKTGFVLNFVLFNSFLTILTEILSLLRCLTQWGIFFGWLLFILLLFLFWIFPGNKRKPMLPTFDLSGFRLGDWAILTLIALIFVIVGLVAFFAPIRTADVLNYHLPRVAHWLQNQSVGHYPSGIEIQNRYPPGAEYQVAHLFALAGGDVLVKFAAWSMLVTACVSAALVSNVLGGGITTQLFSALFVVTMPIAIIQASSVKNDLHVAAWTLVLAALMFVYVKKNASWLVLAGIILTAGMGYLTKSAAMLFMLPLILWFSVRYVLTHSLRRTVYTIIAALALFLAINGGFLWRNFQTYGGVQDFGNSSRLLNDEITVLGTSSNVIRNLAFILQYPWDEFRYRTELFFRKAYVKLGWEINDPRFTSDGEFIIFPLTTHETFSVNLLHAHIIFLTMGIMVLCLLLHKAHPLYGVLVVGSVFGLVAFSAVVKWQVFGARYLLPMFFLAAPVAVDVIARLRGRWLNASFSIVLFLCAIPWLFSIEHRPLVPIPHFSSRPSVIVVSQFDPGVSPPGLDRLEQLTKETGCDQIGIYGSGQMSEYQIWKTLDAPRRGFTLRWLVSGTPSAVYVDPDFDPCLIVCYSCSKNLEEIDDLVLIIPEGAFKIYGPSE
jgi:hypothetical protein